MEPLLPTIIASMIVWLPILISVVALVLSGLSLYFTHLRSSNIILTKTKLSNRTDVRMNGRDGVWAEPITLFYKLYLENLGSRAGSFEGLNLSITPQKFNHFSFYLDTQLRSAEAVDGQYKLLPERFPVKEGEVIPVMMAVKFQYKFNRQDFSPENFRTLWIELTTLKRQEKPDISIRYTVKEYKGTFANPNKLKEKVVIKNISEDIVGVYTGILKEIADVPQQRDYKVAQWALGIANK